MWLVRDRASSIRLTQYKQNWDEVGVGELVTVKGDTLKQILLLWCEEEPVRKRKASTDEPPTLDHTVANSRIQT